MEFIIEYMSISVKSSSNVHTCPYTSPRVSSHLNTFPVTTCPLLTPCIAGLAVHGRGQLHQQRPRRQRRLRDHPGLRGGQAASGECLDVDWGCNEQSGTNEVQSAVDKGCLEPFPWSDGDVKLETTSQATVKYQRWAIIQEGWMVVGGEVGRFGVSGVRAST